MQYNTGISVLKKLIKLYTVPLTLIMKNVSVNVVLKAKHIHGKLEVLFKWDVCYYPSK